MSLYYMHKVAKAQNFRRHQRTQGASVCNKTRANFEIPYDRKPKPEDIWQNIP